MAITCHHGTAVCVLRLRQAIPQAPQYVSIRFASSPQLTQAYLGDPAVGEDTHEQEARISRSRNSYEFGPGGDDANWLQETKRRGGRRSKWKNGSRLLADG